MQQTPIEHSDFKTNKGTTKPTNAKKLILPPPTDGVACKIAQVANQSITKKMLREVKHIHDTK